MSKYWFKSKTYGYGVTPCTWQGWVATFVLIALIMMSYFSTFQFEEGSMENWRNWCRYLLDVFIIASLFLMMFRDRTEGDLKWRWGKDNS